MQDCMGRGLPPACGCARPETAPGGRRGGLPACRTALVRMHSVPETPASCAAGLALRRPGRRRPRHLHVPANRTERRRHAGGGGRLRGDPPASKASIAGAAIASPACAPRQDRARFPARTVMRTRAWRACTRVARRPCAARRRRRRAGGGDLPPTGAAKRGMARWAATRRAACAPLGEGPWGWAGRDAAWACAAPGCGAEAGRGMAA